VKRSQVSVLLSMFAIFGSGIVVGAFGYHSYTANTVSATAVVPVKKDPEDWRRRYVDAIRTRLNLEQTQLGQLNTILDQTKARFKDLKERQKQETDEIRAEQLERIRGMLTAAQKPEFEKFREERERKMKEQAAKEQAAKHAGK
jgi:DNA anti-recombination protein RmuC